MDKTPEQLAAESQRHAEMMESKRNKRQQEGYIVLLTLLFVGLKLTGYIAWSWWWVMSPLWIFAAVFVVIGAFTGDVICGGIVGIGMIVVALNYFG